MLRSKFYEVSMSFLDGAKRIHFIGAGGSGMFPLEQILISKGFLLSGSDVNETATLDSARKIGVDVHMGHKPEHVNNADIVIYSAAIAKDNPEIIAANVQKIPTYERSELLGLISSWYDNAVCVAGTHGKTTVTAMISSILLADDIDISAVIGGKLPLIGGSGRCGTSDTIVIEACEFSNTFLKLNPNISVILNIDHDHMDYFKTMDNLRDSFTKFINMNKSALIYANQDENTAVAVKNSDFRGERITFGWNADSDYFPDNIRKIDDFTTSFTLMQNDERIDEITIQVPGRHNVLNAVAACATSLAAGCKIPSLNKGLATFHGAGRRFERLLSKNGVTIVDDYAHHPAEIAATLRTAKAMNFKRVWAVHQPFTFSRTYELMNEFAEALSIADKILLTDIMGGREVNAIGVKSEDLAAKIPQSVLRHTLDEAAEYVIERVQPGDLVITLGCGDVNKAANRMVQLLNK
jgi:UDP-N-acetylmuramate--alanine ligase